MKIYKIVDITKKKKQMVYSCADLDFTYEKFDKLFANMKKGQLVVYENDIPIYTKWKDKNRLYPS